MSIYCSTFGFDEHKPRCKRLKKISAKTYEQDDRNPCTCGVLPIRYQHSGVLPSNKDERGGYLSLGAIPSHITRDGRDNRPEGGKWWPWLRISLSANEMSLTNDDTVVLTRKQVKALRDALNLWLETSTEHDSGCPR